MAEMNFAEFQMKVLQGIGYSNISTTNRAYQWIKNNSTIDNPCLSYLKNYITEENFVTQKEMNLYKNLIQTEEFPATEEEIDKALAEFYGDCEQTTDFDHTDVSSIENELEKGEAYLKELEFAKQLYQRQLNKIQDEINVMKNKNRNQENSIEALLQRSKKVDTLFNEASKKLQNDLNELEKTFHKLIDENSTEDEHSVFRINFENFKKINSTFRDTVDFILEKLSRKVPLCVNDAPTTISNELEKYNISCDKSEEDWKQAEDLVLIAHSLGERTYENIMIKCEEVELNQTINFLHSLKSEMCSQNGATSTGTVFLESQTSNNNEIIKDLKDKSGDMHSALEKFHKNNPLQEILASEKFKMEQKLKSDKKYLRKLSDLCSKYFDLITLQACFLENEKENVILAVELYDRGISILEDMLQKDSKAMKNLENLQNQNKPKDLDNSFIQYTMELLRINDFEKSTCEMIQKYPKAVCDFSNRILSSIAFKRKEILNMQIAFSELDKIILNGPAKQPFYNHHLLADKRIIELQYVEFNKIYRGFKIKYTEELANMNKDEYLKMEKSLWITFLTNPKALQENLQTLRQLASAGSNKSAVVKGTESMLTIADKKNGTMFF